MAEMRWQEGLFAARSGRLSRRKGGAYLGRQLSSLVQPIMI